jgi:hypothetical protein
MEFAQAIVATERRCRKWCGVASRLQFGAFATGHGAAWRLTPGKRLGYNGAGMSPKPASAESVNGVPIRLPEERWQHIIEGHEDLANYYGDVLGVINQPEAVFQGRRGSLIAIRSYGRRGHLAVFYREASLDDGFVITARFLRARPRAKRVWPRK